MDIPLGSLTGIGIGPGDPDLITVKALRRLQTAPIVAFPAGRNGQPGISEAAIAAWLTPHQQQLPLIFPYVQDPAILTAAWQTAAHQVLCHLQMGKDVVFASEGDISFYSTFSYLAQHLRELAPTVTIEAIPGVCSPLAAAAVLGRPLVCQSERLAILPALYRVNDLEAVLAWADVLVLLKVSSVYPQVWQILRQHGLLETSSIVQQATTPQQIVYADLSLYPDLNLPYFSILITQVRSVIGKSGPLNAGANMTDGLV